MARTTARMAGAYPGGRRCAIDPQRWCYRAIFGNVRHERSNGNPALFCQPSSLSGLGFGAAARPVEWIDGRVVAMAPEGVPHARIKARVWRAMDEAIRVAGVPCEALPDGVTVEIDDTTDFEPDALINCGEKMSGDLIAAPNPLVVVEVLSPTNKSTDTGRKLMGYFRVASIQHYLIINPEKPAIVHHKRIASGEMLTTIVTAGEIILDPPGIMLPVDAIYRN